MTFPEALEVLKGRGNPLRKRTLAGDLLKVAGSGLRAGASRPSGLGCEIGGGFARDFLGKELLKQRQGQRHGAPGKRNSYFPC